MSNQCQGQICGRAEVFMDVNHVGNLERGSPSVVLVFTSTVYWIDIALCCINKFLKGDGNFQVFTSKLHLIHF